MKLQQPHALGCSCRDCITSIGGSSSDESDDEWRAGRDWRAGVVARKRAGPECEVQLGGERHCVAFLSDTPGVAYGAATFACDCRSFLYGADLVARRLHPDLKGAAGYEAVEAWRRSCKHIRWALFGKAPDARDLDGARLAYLASCAGP